MSYLNSYTDYFWTWEDQGQIISLREGHTVAYTSFVAEVFQLLKPNGLPRFSVLIAALAVTDAYNGYANYKSIHNNFVSSEIDPFEQHNKIALEFLKDLTRIPGEFKYGEKRNQLLFTLFSKNHNGLGERKVTRIVTKLNEIALGDAENVPECEPRRKADGKQDLYIISILQRRFKDATGLLEAVVDHEGLDFDIKLDDKPPLGNTPTKDNETKDLITALSEYEKTYKIGRLVKSIWSGLNIPYLNNQPSSQPLGGIADISNKGNFEQLLISEFANDDLTFMSRLANNEALYLEREVPPEDNTFERILLVDTSIRNWGTPKTIALAIALAISQHPKNNFSCRTILLAEEAREYPLDTVGSVVEAQLCLSTQLNAAETLDSYLRETKLGNKTQVFYIGSIGGLRNEAMNHCLSENRAKLDYKILLTELGDVSIYKTQGLSQRHVQDFKLDLNKHWSKPLPAQRIPEEGSIKDLALPILLPLDYRVKCEIFTENSEHFLFFKHFICRHVSESFYYRVGKGVEYIGQNSLSDSYEIGVTKSKETIILNYYSHNKKVTLTNFTTGESTDFQFPYVEPIPSYKETSLREFVFYEDFFYLRGSNGWRISIDGKITPDTTFSSIEKTLRNRTNLMIKPSSLGYANFVILRNMKKVFVNERNNLVLNSSEFIINSKDEFKLKHSKFKEEVHLAEQIGENHFKFHNGSEVYQNYAGFAVFKPAGNSPTFFIPTVLEDSIGIATSQYFSGDDYYQKCGSFVVRFKVKEEQQIQFVKSIEIILSLDLADAKLIVDRGRESITLLSSDKANELMQKIRPFCTEVFIEERNPEQPLKFISEQKFYSTIIAPFINDITNYED